MVVSASAGDRPAPIGVLVLIPAMRPPSLDGAFGRECITPSAADLGDGLLRQGKGLAASRQPARTGPPSACAGGRIGAAAASSPMAGRRATERRGAWPACSWQTFDPIRRCLPLPSARRSVAQADASAFRGASADVRLVAAGHRAKAGQPDGALLRHPIDRRDVAVLAVRQALPARRARARHGRCQTGGGARREASSAAGRPHLAAVAASTFISCSHGRVPHGSARPAVGLFLTRSHRGFARWSPQTSGAGAGRSRSFAPCAPPGSVLNGGAGPPSLAPASSAGVATGNAGRAA